MFELINNKKNYQNIIDQIQKMILNKDLKNGDKLPPERELTEKFGVSRTSVREALKALEVIGIVESRQGEGNFIVNNLLDYTTKGLSLMYALNDGTLDELTQFRRCLEFESIRNIIERNDKRDIEQLRDIINKYNDATIESELVELDKLFHATIINLSNNLLYKYQYNMLSGIVMPYIEDAINITKVNYPYPKKTLKEEHNSIFKAIENKDIDEAFEALTKHLILNSKDKTEMKKLRLWNI